MFPKDEKVFTIGSCFARNVENHLKQQGVTVLGTHTIPNEFYISDQKKPFSRGAFNAYTPKSMLELLNLESLDPSSTKGALAIGDNLYIDMMASGTKQLCLSDFVRLRNIMCSGYAELREASTVIITLGYTESWYDSDEGIFVNRAPLGIKSLMKNGARFNFYNDNYTSVSNTLDEIVKKVKDICSDDVKIIFTVSPVPLGNTFTELDVVKANIYSKSTLLTAVYDYVNKHSFVDYYPSYEMVSFSHRTKTWAEDGVHVQSAVVSKVISKFIELYFK